MSYTFRAHENDTTDLSYETTLYADKVIAESFVHEDEDNEDYKAKDTPRQSRYSTYFIRNPVKFSTADDCLSDQAAEIEERTATLFEQPTFSDTEFGSPCVTFEHDAVFSFNSEKNTKTDKMHDSAECIREVLTNRYDMITQLGTTIHNSNATMGNIVGVLGLALAHPAALLATPLIHIANKKFTKLNQDKMTKALEALDDCIAPNTPKEKQLEDYEVLVRTAYNIQHWETAQHLGIIAAKMVFAHVSEAAEAGMALYEMIKEAREIEKPATSAGKEHSDKPTSKTLLQAVTNLGDALGLNKVHQLHPDNNNTPQYKLSA